MSVIVINASNDDDTFIHDVLMIAYAQGAQFFILCVNINDTSTFKQEEVYQAVVEKWETKIAKRMKELREAIRFIPVCGKLPSRC